MIRLGDILPIGTAYILLSYSGVAFACDIPALKINIGWLKTNNTEAYSRLVGACNSLNGGPDSGNALTAISSAYKNGQSHDPGAAAAIDGCTDVQIIQVCGAFH